MHSRTNKHVYVYPMHQMQAVLTLNGLKASSCLCRRLVAYLPCWQTLVMVKCKVLQTFDHHLCGLIIFFMELAFKFKVIYMRTKGWMMLESDRFQSNTSQWTVFVGVVALCFHLLIKSAQLPQTELFDYYTTNFNRMNPKSLNSIEIGTRCILSFEYLSKHVQQKKV